MRWCSSLFRDIIIAPTGHAQCSHGLHSFIQHQKTRQSLDATFPKKDWRLRPARDRRQVTVRDSSPQRFDKLFFKERQLLGYLNISRQIDLNTKVLLIKKTRKS